MKGKELQVVSFVNNRHDLRKRNAVRRARCKRFRIETAVTRLINLCFSAGAIMVFISCLIIGNPEAAIPWGLLIGGSLLATINGVLKYSLEGNDD